MKYFIKISIFLVLLVISYQVNAQNLTKIGIQSGFVMLDRFHHNSDILNRYYSSTMQTDIVFFRQIYLRDKLNYNLGLGYTQFNFLAGSSSALGHHNKSLSYVTFKTNIELKVLGHKWSLNFGQSTYVLLNNVKQDDYPKPEKPDNFLIKKAFTNLDLGITYSLSKKWDIGLSAPLTIYPMYSGIQTTSPNSHDAEFYNLFIETTGANIMFTYKI
jgi:uncharacterized membrane protein YciS (DUF1049 family)